jgi:hypothetical protein
MYTAIRSRSLKLFLLRQNTIWLLIISLLLFSCKKEVSWSEKKTITKSDFFTTKNVSSEIKTVIESFKKQLEQNDFLDEFITVNGTPQWEDCIKINSSEFGLYTLLIPTKKDERAIGFFAATVLKNNDVLFEMHRVGNEMEPNYTYCGISKQRASYFNSIFIKKGYSTKNSKTEATPTSNSAPQICWWVYQSCANRPADGGVAIIQCNPWVERCEDDWDPDFVEGGGGSGGGGGCQNCEPPPTCYVTKWYSRVIPNDCPPSEFPTSYAVAFLADKLQLDATRINWLNQHQSEASLIKDAIIDNRVTTTTLLGGAVISENPDALLASKCAIDAARHGYITAPMSLDHYNNTFAESIPDAPNYGTVDPMLGVYFSLQCALIKIEHPEWSNLRVYWEASKKILHGGLDIVGLIPFVGEVADLANGFIYSIEGDGVNATLSFAATVPIAGWGATVTKFAKKVITAIDGSTRTLKWIKRTDGFIDFGDRGLLRKILGLAKGDARIAHHMIPWEHGTKPIVQKAADMDFHLNELLNGVPLTAIQHSGSHFTYNQKIGQKLTDLWNANPGMSASDAAAEVRNLGNQIRSWITAHPNESVNNIIL